MQRLQKCAHRGVAMLALAIALCGPSMSGVPSVHENTGAVVDPARDAVAPVRARPVPPSDNPLWAIPLSELSATGERPIFSPSRRRPAPAVFEVAAAQPPKLVSALEPTRPPLVLVGTIIGASRQIGVFLEETTKEMVRLTAGESHGGWILRSADNRSAQFEKGERAANLMLRPPDQSKVPGSAAIPTAELIPPVRHRKR